MDASRFDTLTRALTIAGSRRLLLGTALAGVLGALWRGDAEARLKPCPPCRQRRRGKCHGRLPDGSKCPRGTCRGGQCLRFAVCPAACPVCQSCTSATTL